MSFSKIIAMDIGTHNIKIIQAKTKKDKIRVDKYLMFDTPNETVEDGYILDIDTLAVQIKNKLRFNKIKGKDVIITVTGTSIITREIILPVANAKELNGIVNNEAPRVFPVNTDDYSLDYKILEEITSDKGKQYRILMVAAPSRMIEGYIQLAEKCDLNINSIDYMGNSLSKFINNQEEYKYKLGTTDDNQIICAIDMGSHMTTVIIMENGILKFVRMFSYDGQKFAKEITAVTLEQQLNQQAKSNENDMPGFIKEVASIFNFYYSRNEHNKIDKIYLVGGSSKVKDINQYFENTFDVKTESLKEFTNVKYSKQCSGFKDVQAHFAGCLGALINE